MNNTALGAENKKEQIINFISEAHEKFYYEKLKEVRYQDVYHKALCYCFGISDDIRQYGVLVPGIARPRTDGGYELISGHRRKHGSQRAGKSEMPVIVRNYFDDEATIIMVDSNIQREDILTSEKAKAYKMKYEIRSYEASGEKIWQVYINIVCYISMIPMRQKI